MTADLDTDADSFGPTSAETPTTTVYLVRHGETAWNREGRVQGWAATGLTERGRAQATALGRWVADADVTVDRVVVSDLQRTRETDAAVREYADLPEPSFSEALRERAFGVYQGFLAVDLFERFPTVDDDLSVSALDMDPEGGESIQTFRERVLAGWDELTASADTGETLLVVTHGGVVKVLLGALTDRDPDDALAAHSPENCSLTEFELVDGNATLRREGATPWRELVEASEE